jgi:hypothetical protein
LRDDAFHHDVVGAEHLYQRLQLHELELTALPLDLNALPLDFRDDTLVDVLGLQLLQAGQREFHTLLFHRDSTLYGSDLGLVEFELLQRRGNGLNPKGRESRADLPGKSGAHILVPTNEFLDPIMTGDPAEEARDGRSQLLLDELPNRVR